jgi:N-acyl-L-homoserine lactone synthetase
MSIHPQALRDHAITSVPVPQPPVGAVRNICAFLTRVEYKIMTTPNELSEIAKLRYQSYLAMDLMAENSEEAWHDEFDTDPAYRNIGVFLDGQLVGGIRLNPLNREYRRSMAAEMYPSIMDGMLADGDSFVEATRFFTHPSLGHRSRELPYAIIRLVGVAARYHCASHALMNIQANHVPFYERTLGARMVPGSLMPYKDHSKEVQLLLVTSEIDPMLTSMLYKSQYFLTTPGEMEALFGSNSSNGFVRPGVMAALDGSEQWA